MKMEKVRKLLGEDVLAEIEAMDEATLKNTVVQSEQNIATAKKEMEANDQFKAAKSILKDLRGGFNDVKKFQTAKIVLALSILNPSETTEEES